MDVQNTPYSWHQSHDQTTVMVVVPYETTEEDVIVIIDDNHLIAGVRGQLPTVKGRLYGSIEVSTSMWQLEQRAPSEAAARPRTISTVSSGSTQYSYAMVSEPEISSSFAASVADGSDNLESEGGEVIAPSPGLSSPYETPARDFSPFSTAAQHYQLNSQQSSHPTSPSFNPSLLSSLSSMESLHTSLPGRLLTLHLEKLDPAMWPSLISGPVPEDLHPSVPGPANLDPHADGRYNMDATSLGLIGLEFFERRGDRTEAFEYLVRAWRQAHTPLTVMSLVSHYFPLLASSDRSVLDPQITQSYHVQAVGGASGLAALYLQAGLFHLEGAANTALSSTHFGLSSIRSNSTAPSHESVEAWCRDRESARRYFARARFLAPYMDVPLLPSEGEDSRRTQLGFSRCRSTQMSSGNASDDQKMPTIDFTGSVEALFPSEQAGDADNNLRLRRGNTRREADRAALLRNTAQVDEWDGAWYLYIPGLVGAGTALLVVGVVGALSFSSWRKTQS